MAQSEHAKMGKEYLNLARTALGDAARSRSPENSARCIRGSIAILKLALEEYEKETNDAAED